jgi:perosamine synthetase
MVEASQPVLKHRSIYRHFHRGGGYRTNRNDEKSCDKSGVQRKVIENPCARPPMITSDRVPKLPLFSRTSFRRFGPAVPCVLDAGEVKYFTLGRMALATALKDAQIGKGDEIMMPAYHCIVMVDAVLSVHATPIFYRIESNTAVDLKDIEERITPSTRALLVAHYFGFPQMQMRAIRNLCDARNLLLIEDCAHALLGGNDDKRLGFGAFGDYVIASPYKFLPAVDGGCLISRRRSLARIELRSAGARHQLKTVINLCEFAIAHRRLRALSSLRVLLQGRERLRAAMGVPKEAPSLEAHADENGLSVEFDPFWIDMKASWCSRLIMKCAAWNGIAQQRRKHYQRLDDAFRDLPGCLPLFTHLPGDVVPQVYPLLVDEAEIAFPQLKAIGVPIIRFGEFLWEHMDRSVCPVSLDLSRRVFQFPCHQDLRCEELDWIIRTVREVMERVHLGEPKNGHGR